MEHDNVKLACRWFEEVWNQKRPEAIEELSAQDGICHSVAGTITSPQDFRDKVHSGFIAAFPDLQIAIEDTLAQGDQVAVRWMARGTHTGEGMGMPPSNREVQFRGISWIRFRDGMMVEGWDCWDLHGLLQSLQPAAV